MSSDSQNQNYTYEIIEIGISTISLACCFLMCYIYGKEPKLKMFSYATQFYILTGALLFTALDFIFNCYYFDALITECQDTEQVDFESSMCQITSYISTYGIMNMICWQTVLVSITKQAVLQKKIEQFSGHIYLITYAFFAPLLYTIIPQLSNESIYGPFDNVCWLQYNFTHNYTSPISCKDNSRNENEFRLLKGTEDTYFYANYNDIILFSILFYFIPIIVQCLYQIKAILDIQKEIKKSEKSNDSTLSESHVKAIESLKILPVFFLVVVTIPLCLFCAEFDKDGKKVNQWVFQVFKGMLSATSLVLMFAFSRNEYLYKVAKKVLFGKKDQTTQQINKSLSISGQGSPPLNVSQIPQEYKREEVIDLFQGVGQ